MFVCWWGGLKRVTVLTSWFCHTYGFVCGRTAPNFEQPRGAIRRETATLETKLAFGARICRMHLLVNLRHAQCRRFCLGVGTCSQSVPCSPELALNTL